MSTPESQLRGTTSTPENSSIMADNSQQSMQSSQSCSSLSEQSQSRGKENLEDYETQFFGFTPKSFVSGIYNAVSEYFMEALQILEDYLQKQYSNTMSGSEVGERMTVIRKHLVTQIDKAFDTLETYLANNILCIPAGMVLPEDQVQMDSPVSEEEFVAVQQEIQLMKNKILAIKLANAILKQRLQHTIQVQETMDGVIEHLNNMHATTRSMGVVDLRDSLNHCAQTVLNTLRVLSSIKLNELTDGPAPAKKHRGVS